MTQGQLAGSLMGRRETKRYFQAAHDRPRSTKTRSTRVLFLLTSKNFKGTSNRRVSRSSRMAKVRAFLKSQVAVRPAAASMEKRTPTEVGAANLPASRASHHKSRECQSSGG